MLWLCQKMPIFKNDAYPENVWVSGSDLGIGLKIIQERGKRQKEWMERLKMGLQRSI